MPFRSTVLAFGGLLLLAACAPRPVLDAPATPDGVAFPNHTLADVLSAMDETAERDALATYTSQGRLLLRSPERDVEVSLTLRQTADTLWASLRGPLNLEVARLLVAPDSVWLHDRFRNLLLVGPAEAVQRLLPGPITSEEAFRTLTGTLRPAPDVPWIVNPGSLDGLPVYWLTAPDASQRLAVSPTTWRVLRYDRLTPGRGVTDSRRFADFAPVEGRLLPQRVVLSDPSAGLEVTIEHRRLVLNPPGLAFPFSPGTARRVPFAAEALLPVLPTE